MSILLYDLEPLQRRLYGHLFEEEEPPDEAPGGTDGESYDNLFKALKTRRQKRKERRRARKARRRGWGGTGAIPMPVERETASQAARGFGAPATVQRKPPSLGGLESATQAPTATVSKLPLYGAQGAAHKAVNRAMQEEYKTKQEEARAQGMQKKAEQEALKSEKIKANTGLAKNAKYIVWFVAIAGTIKVGYDAYLEYKGKK